MKWLFIIFTFISILIIIVFSIYFVKLNNLEEFYNHGYNTCIEVSKVKGNFAITKDNINSQAVSYLQSLYPEEVQSCIDNNGCFSSCGNPCNYVNPKDLNFIEIVKFKSNVCLTVCVPQCFYKL
ncbi:hypothetical protein FJZ21_03270 [Candidatus Pacearchaeota archaeon]|nr:hypothetical protein [Candidatus Pacearchaeota archaeon]